MLALVLVCPLSLSKPSTCLSVLPDKVHVFASIQASK